jgi:hypothetical protein
MIFKGIRIPKTIVMLKGTNLKPYIAYSLIAAMVYIIPVIFFLKAADYTRAWLLYLGNFLFLLAIAFFLFSFNRKRERNAGTLVMLTATSIATVIGTALAFILSLGLLFIFVPDLFQPGTTERALAGAPDNSVLDKTNGLMFMVLANSLVGNISCGHFVAIIFPFAMKGDQTKEKVPKRKQAEL